MRVALRACLCLHLLGGIFGLRLGARSTDTCGEAVAGAVKSSSRKCRCPSGEVLLGGPPSGKWACVGQTGFERTFKPEEVTGKGCRCGVKESSIGLGEDGNPFDWDRYRRCDDDYDPPCSLCEGVGGIVDSDEKTQVQLAFCEVVARKDEIDPATVKKPIWHNRFTAISHEILIGKKNDPACFQAFPSNDSTAPMCYKPQIVKLSSDMVKAKALRLDINQAGNAWGLIGNVTSRILHQYGNMWITNSLPFGVTQTICAAPREGMDPSKPAVAPLQYNWTHNLRFMGREKIEVEYGYGLATLDHWIFGPHHVWTDPQTGMIVRMWQPFNGLQIFERNTYRPGVDDSLFTELVPEGTKAPRAAMPGGSTFRVTCGENGFNVNREPGPDSTELVSRGVGHGRSSVKDLQRARTKVPRKAYRGEDFTSMSATLNKWLLRHAPNSRQCDTWTIANLQQLQLQLIILRDPELDSVYTKTKDNRRLRADLAEIQKEWQELNALAEESPELANVHRDGHCHEAVMWYVHHLPEAVKSHLKDQIALPLLSHMRHDLDIPQSNASLAAQEVHKAYRHKVSCADCHTAVFPA